VTSAIRGKRGQEFLRELASTLDAMPEKRLIQNELVQNGEFCTLGVIGAKRGLNMAQLDPDSYDAIADKLGIAHQLVQEIEWENDEGVWGDKETPENRWKRMRAWVESQLRAPKGDV
jgi:hypothetical protein